VNFVLLLVKHQLRVAGHGTLSLDGQRATALPGGNFSGELAVGSLTLLGHGIGGYDATFPVNVRVGEPAALAAPIRASQSGSVAAGKRCRPAVLHIHKPGMPVSVDGAMKVVTNRGVLETVLSTGVHSIVTGKIRAR
jgi:hypothetical protein